MKEEKTHAEMGLLNGCGSRGANRQLGATPFARFIAVFYKRDVEECCKAEDEPPSSLCICCWPKAAVTSRWQSQRHVLVW